MIKTLIICVSGFGVDDDDTSAVRTMASHLRETYESPECAVFYHPWDSPWHHYARRLDKLVDINCRTIFLAHSYGCGWGLKRFEQEWRRKGRAIDLALMIDPVPRAFNLFFIGNLFSLTRWGVVRTRALRVHLFRQVNDDPFGRRVKLKGEGQVFASHVFGTTENLFLYEPFDQPCTQITDDLVGHTSIDGLPLVRRVVYRRIKDFVGETP